MFILQSVSQAIIWPWTYSTLLQAGKKLLCFNVTLCRLDRELLGQN